MGPDRTVGAQAGLTAHFPGEAETQAAERRVAFADSRVRVGPETLLVVLFNRARFDVTAVIEAAFSQEPNGPRESAAAARRKSSAER